jgi:DNA replication protein DnaC
MAKETPRRTPNPTELRDRILDDFRVLKVPLKIEQLDTLLVRAESEGLSHQQFLHLLLAEQADQRRERAIARRIYEARFREVKDWNEFDWNFNASSIKRSQMEELATGEFIRRRNNLMFVGQTGLGKSTLIQMIGQRLCVLGYRVHYITSADLLSDLNAALATQTLPKRIRFYAKFDLLVIDEFGFDYIERLAMPPRQAANLIYKIIDTRNQKHSTALITNVDFKAWEEYLGDPPIILASLDRMAHGAIVLKLQGKSYRAHQANQPPSK